ncbi:hypothetical protein [Nocardia sp. NPDC024068]|uniref:hypothetical protein n=1 Tax=Nocardia sp. NPDC024068 TaxID=3157197 RepID=UPI00340E9961
MLSDWACWSIAALALISLALLFQPWLSASGPSGDVHTDAFGRLEGSVPGLATAGERPVDGVASISALGGTLTAAATLIILSGLLLYRMFGIGRRAVIAGSAATAVSGPATLLYLHGKAPEVSAMTEYRDGLKAAFDVFLNSFLGGDAASAAGTSGQAATVALTNQAILGSLAAVATGVFALGLRNRIRSVADVADAPWVTAQRHVVGEPATRPNAAREADELLRRQLEQLTRYEHRLSDRDEPVSDDERHLSDESDTQRLLRRNERPDRAENQPGQIRRDRNTSRRTRPRPGKRAPCTPQTGTRTAATREGRSAARSGSSSATPRYT